MHKLLAEMKSSSFGIYATLRKSCTLYAIVDHCRGNMNFELIGEVIGKKCDGERNAIDVFEERKRGTFKLANNLLPCFLVK